MIKNIIVYGLGFCPCCDHFMWIKHKCKLWDESIEKIEEKQEGGEGK